MENSFQWCVCSTYVLNILLLLVSTLTAQYWRHRLCPDWGETYLNNLGFINVPNICYVIVTTYHDRRLPSISCNRVTMVRTGGVDHRRRSVPDDLEVPTGNVRVRRRYCRAWHDLDGALRTGYVSVEALVNYVFCINIRNMRTFATSVSQYLYSVLSALYINTDLFYRAFFYSRVRMCVHRNNHSVLHTFLSDITELSTWLPQVLKVIFVSFL